MDEPDPPPAREWPIPPMDHEAGCKPSAFSWEMARLIVARIAEGETVKAITDDPRMPSYATVYHWMRRAPEFGDAIAEVRRALARNRLNHRDAVRAAKGPKRRSGRRSTWCAGWAAGFLEELRQGASLTEATARPDMPSAKVVYTWLRDRPAFRAAFAKACSDRAWGLELQTHPIIDDAMLIGLKQAKAMVAKIDGRIGRLTPRVYRAPPRGMRR